MTIEGDPLPRCDSIDTDFVRVEMIPTADVVIDAPSGAPIGTPVTFDASRTRAEDSEILAYYWDFGDGNIAEGSAAEHVFRERGDYGVTLTVRTDDSSECAIVKRTQGISINAPPIAVAGADREVYVGESVRFSAIDSGDMDGAIIEYSWRFGDGESGTGMETMHTFTTPGTYAVALTVRDDSGLSNALATDTAQITVNQPKAPDIIGPRVACPDRPTRWEVDAAGDSHDPSNLSWLLGDGRTASGASILHTYERPGRYDLTLLAGTASPENQPAQANMEVTVNAPPVAYAGRDIFACPGTAVHFDGNGSYDGDGRLIGAMWEFGDGSASDSLTAIHVYDKPGTYRVRLTVTDDSESVCAEASDTLLVRVNSPPIAEPGSDLEGFAGGANDFIILDGSRSSDADGNDLSFYWNIGSGDELAGERIRYRFRRAGEYDVRLTVSDKTGLPCGTDTGAVKVTIRDR